MLWSTLIGPIAGSKPTRRRARNSPRRCQAGTPGPARITPRRGWNTARDHPCGPPRRPRTPPRTSDTLARTPDSDRRDPRRSETSTTGADQADQQHHSEREHRCTEKHEHFRISVGFAGHRGPRTADRDTPTSLRRGMLRASHLPIAHGPAARTPLPVQRFDGTRPPRRDRRGGRPRLRRRICHEPRHLGLRRH